MSYQEFLDITETEKINLTYDFDSRCYRNNSEKVPHQSTFRFYHVCWKKQTYRDSSAIIVGLCDIRTKSCIANLNTTNGQVALPKLEFTDYEVWKALAPHKLADILVRKNLLDESQAESYFTFNRYNLFFGNHFNGLEEIKKSYVEIEKDKQVRIDNQRNGFVF